MYRPAFFVFEPHLLLKTQARLTNRCEIRSDLSERRQCEGDRQILKVEIWDIYTTVATVIVLGSEAVNDPPHLLDAVVGLDPCGRATHISLNPSGLRENQRMPQELRQILHR